MREQLDQAAAYIRKNRLYLTGGALALAASVVAGCSSDGKKPSADFPSVVRSAERVQTGVAVPVGLDKARLQYPKEIIDASKADLAPGSKLLIGQVSDVESKVIGQEKVEFRISVLTEDGKEHKLHASSGPNGNQVTNFLALYGKPGTGVIFGVDTQGSITGFLALNPVPPRIKTP